MTRERSCRTEERGALADLGHHDRGAPSSSITRPWDLSQDLGKWTRTLLLLLLLGFLGGSTVEAFSALILRIFRSSIHANIIFQVQYRGLRYPRGGEGCATGQRWEDPDPGILANWEDDLGIWAQAAPNGNFGMK